MDCYVRDLYVDEWNNVEDLVHPDKLEKKVDDLVDEIFDEESDDEDDSESEDDE